MHSADASGDHGGTEMVLLTPDPALQSLGGGTPPSPLSRGDIASHVLGLVLDFLDACLDDVTDRDDSSEAAVLDDGQMAEAASGHAAHDAVDRFVFAAGHHLARHDRVDPCGEDIAAAV